MPYQPFASTAEPAARALVVMGVSGSGKSDISREVASRLQWRHIEADDFHSAENVARMRDGIPLNDDDRRQWLDALCQEMLSVQATGEGFVLACSALKQAYRERLRQAVPGLSFVHLRIDPVTALQRVGNRPGHFMPASLVDSQFSTLEDPEGEPGVLVLDAVNPRKVLVEEACNWFQSDRFAGAEENLLSPQHDSANNSSEEHIYAGRVAHLFDRLTDGMMALLMAFMVVAVFGNVVLRYAFGTGWAGAEELSRLAFVWLVFVGVASSMRRGELMCFRMIRDRFPGLAQRLVDSCSWLLVTVASLLSAVGAWNQMEYGWGNVSTVTGYPLVLTMLPILCCMSALVILALVQLVNVWRRPLTGASTGMASIAVD